MERCGNRVRKEEVFNFANEVEKFLKLLEGTYIQSDNELTLEKIKKQKECIELLLYDFKPNLYDEYSKIVKIAYEKMISAKREYERVVMEHCSNYIIESAKENYNKNAAAYESYKEFRNSLKLELSK